MQIMKEVKFKHKNLLVKGASYSVLKVKVEIM